MNFLTLLLKGFIIGIAKIIPGVSGALTMIIPGISGTAVMMILGCYNLLLNFLSSLTSVAAIFTNIFKVIPYLLGIVLCVIILSKVMTYLFDKKRSICTVEFLDLL